MIADDELPRRALVLGLARSGEAAALALLGRGVEIRAVDRDASLDAGRLRAAGVEVVLGADDPALLAGVDLVVKSPGVPSEARLVAAAREHAVPLWSEVELGYRLLRRPILGVTGTNGKTTTAELLGAVFRAAGRPVDVAGNVGRPLTGLVGAAVPDDAWIVCELSSFQLEDVHRFRARVAVLLNLEPDHLDRHGTFERYAAAKLRIFENQHPDDAAVVPRGFGAVPGEARRVPFAADDALPAEPRIPGRHNRENAAAATAAARAVGIGDAAIAQALREFPGVPHRLETVTELDGVRFVNDSKATNVAAALRSLATFAGEPLHLILGGSLKGEDFGPLARAIQGNVETIHLIGEAEPELARALAAAGRTADVRHDEELDEAVANAWAAAARRPGHVVLLAPACASFDRYRNFEERGEHFRALVRELEERPA